MTLLPVPDSADKLDDAVSPPYARQSIRILVVDDHAIVREGLALRIESERGMKVVGCVATGEEAVTAAQRLQPDVIVMDLVLPGLNGIDATRRILDDLPTAAVVALSACHSLGHVRRALRAGARAYVLKSAAGIELTAAIKKVIHGGTYIGRELLAAYGSDVLQSAGPSNSVESLSDRERQVLQCIVAGLTSSAIAQRLALSNKTIETYRSRMMIKLGAANRAELVELAASYELPQV